jgi:putative ABC transport system permease protein
MRLRPRPLVAPTRLRLADLAAEAVAGMLTRPLRAALTATGTLIGTAAFVAVLGLTATASGQISSAFNQLEATEVTITDAPPDPSLATDPFPAGTDRRLDALDGVVAAGVWWQVQTTGPLTVSAQPPYRPSATTPNTGLSPAVIAASPGYLAAIGAEVSDGRMYGGWQQDQGQKACVLGQGAAYALGITSVRDQAVIFISDVACTVIGIIGHVDREPSAMESVFIPSSAALAIWGQPREDLGSIPGVVIQTRLGAAQLIARQAPYVIDPYHPSRFQVTAPPSPLQLRTQVSTALNGLFLALASICLFIGAVGIANTSLVAVLERVSEIGLRRALGARPRHIAAHFLAESAFLGLLGGLMGTSFGVAAVVAVAVARGWTPVIAPQTVLPTPLIGAATGLLAGIYPAWRAARTEPAQALNR